MITTTGYYDLSILEWCIASETEKTLKSLYEYGYRTIAINQFVDEENIESKRKKKKGEPRDNYDPCPVPFDLQNINKLIKEQCYENFNVFNRLTIIFSNQDSLYKITKSPNYKKFHIIAVQPQTNIAFSFVCSGFDADILTFDPENKFPLKINRKTYYQLVDRGYHFELLYGPTIEDSTKRKNVIHASHLFHSYGRSKNVIISSGTSRTFSLRSSYDIINLGFILGLKEQQCKNAIQQCGRQVIINSVGRRHGKAVMFVENMEIGLQSRKNQTIISIPDSEEEDMETDQPVQKKSKQ